MDTAQAIGAHCPDLVAEPLDLDEPRGGPGERVERTAHFISRDRGDASRASAPERRLDRREGSAEPPRVAFGKVRGKRVGIQVGPLDAAVAIPRSFSVEHGERVGERARACAGLGARNLRYERSDRHREPWPPEPDHPRGALPDHARVPYRRPGGAYGANIARTSRITSSLRICRARGPKASGPTSSRRSLATAG